MCALNDANLLQLVAQIPAVGLGLGSVADGGQRSALLVVDAHLLPRLDMLRRER